MTTHKGSCSCEAVKIEVQGDPTVVSLCHCRNCQKSTSSAYSTNWIYPRSAFKIVSGEPKAWQPKGDGSKQVYRKFCGQCSSTLWIEVDQMPDIIIIKAGIMDDGGIGKFAPTSEAFTSRKPDWVKEVDAARQFTEAWHS